MTGPDRKAGEDRLDRGRGRRPGRRFDCRAGLWAGVAAGIGSTLLQLLIWSVVVDAFPQALFRDARLAAAIVMGEGVLPPPASFDARVMVVATAVHFALSIAYGLLVGLLVRRLDGHASLVAAGAAFGLALYLVNLHGFTVLYPWFAQVRTWDTLLAHLAFGLLAAVVYRRLAAAR